MTQQSTDSFPSAADIRTRLSNLTPEELEALRAIYHDRWRRNWLRADGWLNVFLGGLTLWLGLSGLTLWLGLSGLSVISFPKLVQTLLGALIVGQSLWAIVSPSTSAILRFAITLLGAGIWNLLLAVSADIAGGTFLAGLLGIAQLWWALQTYRGYQWYRQLKLPEPQADFVRFYDEAWHAITKGILKQDSAIIHLWIGRTRWQGLLLGDRGVFALRGGNLLIVQYKDDVSFVPSSSKPHRKRRVYGRIKLIAVFERALMNRDSFETYARWKGEEAVLAAVTPSLWQRLPRAIRIVVMIIGGLVLLYITFVTIGAIGLMLQYN